MSLNIVALAGRLYATPKPLTRPGNETVGAGFVLVTTERVKDENEAAGYRVVENYAHVRVYNPDVVAELVAKEPGDLVCVIGTFYVHEWTVGDEKRRAFYVRAEGWSDSLNLAVAAGNCGADAELQAMGDTGRSKARVRLATEVYERDPISGEGEKKTHWVGGACYWQSKLKAIADYFVKGARMAIVGRYVEETYTPKGKEKPETYAFIKFDQFDFGAKGKGGGVNADGQPPGYGGDEGPVADFDDEIPF